MVEKARVDVYFCTLSFLPEKDGDCLDNGQELHVLNSQKNLSISCFMIMILQYCDFLKPERFRKALSLVVNILFSLESWHTSICKVYEYTRWNPWTLRLPTLSRPAASQLLYLWDSFKAKIHHVRPQIDIYLSHSWEDTVEKLTLKSAAVLLEKVNE